MSPLLLTYHVEILDLLTVTNFIRQNLTTSHLCTLVLPSGILSPYMLKIQLRLTLKSLYLKWKRLNGHWIISITTASLILYFGIDLVNDSVFLIDLIIAHFMSFLWRVWFGTDALVNVLFSLMNCKHACVIYLHMKFITY